jgi:Protein of unknown function (DUF3999)
MTKQIQLQMKIQQMKNKIVIQVATFFLISSAFFGQTNATLEASASGGFHRILLPPTFRSFSKVDLSDVRIVDEQKTEIPYLIASLNSPIFRNHFKAYTIISQQNVSKQKTIVIIEVPNATSDQISLEIANSDVQKTYSLSGSVDLKQWFGLLNDEQLDQLSSNDDATSTTKTIQYPKNKYRYLKFEFLDKTSLPIHVLSAGQLSNSKTIPSLLPLSPTVSVKENKNLKQSEIQLSFASAQVIDRISFTISEPSLFNRAARVFSKNEANEEILISSFTLQSDGYNTFDIPQQFLKDIFVEVQNNDNLPLVFSELNLFQQPMYLFADLKARESYQLVAGDSTLIAPQYDLLYFQDKIESSNLVAKLGTINHIDKAPIQEKIEAVSFWEKPIFLWICILIGAFVIFYFAYTLLREMKQR